MFWRFWSFGVRESKRAMTAIPVPPSMALHQLYSVPPTGRVMDLGTRFGSLIIIILSKEERLFSLFGILRFLLANMGRYSDVAFTRFRLVFLSGLPI